MIPLVLDNYLYLLAVPVFLSYSWYRYRGIEYILRHYRWVFVCVFLLPVSAGYDLYYYARNRVSFRLNSDPQKHRNRVRDVQRQVRVWLQSAVITEKMCTARPGWMAMSLREAKYKRTLYNIDLMALMDVLSVRTHRSEVTVEPLVTIGQLTSVLNALGWTLPVVPELDDLTIGGLICGVGIETSSHKYGLIQHCCISYELVLADGTCVTCSKDENAQLFYAMPWSHGTLGFLVSAVLKIVPAKKYVRLEYRPLFSLQTMCEQVKEASLSKDHATGDLANDFVEALSFSKERHVLMTGTLTDTCEPDKVTRNSRRLVNKIGRYYKPWFYKLAQSTLATGLTRVDYIPLKDYYRRHVRSIFWQMQDIIPFANHPVFRMLFGWLLPPKISLLKLTQGSTIKAMYERYQLIQDMLVPVDSLKVSLEKFHEEVKIYPLWICPFKLFNQPGFIRPSSATDELYVDIGAYGAPHVQAFDNVETTRRLEAFVRQVNGFQMLYADMHMTRPEFRTMFDHTLYDSQRSALRCELAFPDVYDKVNRSARF